jgi:hypothetical protein
MRKMRCAVIIVHLSNKVSLENFDKRQEIFLVFPLY